MSILYSAGHITTQTNTYADLNIGAENVERIGEDGDGDAAAAAGGALHHHCAAADRQPVSWHRDEEYIWR